MKKTTKTDRAHPHSPGRISRKGLKEACKSLLEEEVAQLRKENEELAQENFKLKRSNLELGEENQKLKKTRWKTEELLNANIRKLEKKLSDTRSKLISLKKTLAWFRKEKFGQKSEKNEFSKDDEIETDAIDPEEKTEFAPNKQSKAKRNRGQQRGSKGHGNKDITDVPVSQEIPVTIPDCRCPECGMLYRMLKAVEKSPLLEITTELYQDVYELAKYVSCCDCQGRKIVTAPPPPKLYPRTRFGNSLWIYLLVQKYLHGTPTNRTIKELDLLGFSLAEGTITGGFKIIEELLEPWYQAIKNHCRGASLWNADETTWRVFGSGKKTWWFWVVASNDAVVHLLDESRSKKVPQEFFAGSVGTLMTDRLASYKSLPSSIKKAWCWVHVRRDFLKIFNGVKKHRKWAKTWLKKISKLFVLTHNRFVAWEKETAPELSNDYSQADSALRQHAKDMRDLFEQELSQKLDKQQKTVLNSLKRHWEGLTLFLSDPRIPLHNNRAERLLRNTVIIRKGSYGSGAEWSGRLAAKLFSIFQTCLINGLDPQAVLADYLAECTKTPGSPPKDVTKFLPWEMSSDRKVALRLPKSYTPPG